MPQRYHTGLLHESGKHTLRRSLAALIFCVLSTGFAVYAQTPAPPDTAQKDAAPSAPPSPPPAEPAPQNLPLVTEPPTPDTDNDRAPPALRSVWEGVTLQRLMQDVKITDLAIALAALAMAFFAWSVFTTLRKRPDADGLIDEGRRIIEASENAAEAARRTAETAEQTLGLMRETAERQLRAYVTIKQFVQTPARDGRGSLLQVVWQNTGATPTKGFRYWAMLRDFDDSIPDDFEFTPAGIKDYAGGELGASGTVSSPPLLLPSQTIARMRDGSRKVLLLGQAGYADFGGHHARRETRFCMEVVLAGDGSGEEAVSFSFVYYPRHNYIT
jgi:hypothetical protein